MKDRAWIFVVGLLAFALATGNASAAGEKPEWQVGDFWEFAGWDDQLGGRVNLTQRTEVVAFESLARDGQTHETLRLVTTQERDLWWLGGIMTFEMTQWYQVSDLSLVREQWDLDFWPFSNATANITIEYRPSWQLYAFPLYLGEEWSTSSAWTVLNQPANTTLWIPYTSLHRIPSIIDYPLPAAPGSPDGGRVYRVFELERTVPAGGGLWRYFWSDEVGYWIHHELRDARDVQILRLDLRAHRFGTGSSITAVFPWVTATLLAALLAAALAASSTDRGRLAVSRWFLLPLFTRLKKEEVLDQFTRGRVYQFVEGRPGSHFSEILRHLGLAHGALAYHLSVLEREGMLHSRTQGTRRLFYTRGALPLGESTSAIERVILERLSESPGLTVPALAVRLGAKRQVTLYHVRRLAQTGRLRLERSRLSLRCYPQTTAAPEAAAAQESQD